MKNHSMFASSQFYLLWILCVPTGQAFRQGEYVVTYVAYDAENNSAECSFEIIIRRKLVLCFFLFPFDLLNIPILDKSGRHLIESGNTDKADRGRGRKTTSGNGQAWSSASPRGQWRTGKNGENWLQNHLLCPSDPRS